MERETTNLSEAYQASMLLGVGALKSMLLMICKNKAYSIHLAKKEIPVRYFKDTNDN